ncbi:non-homologous end-joining DNA ligase [Peptococcaceae bacterium 1198_IL3148]
MVKNEIMVEIEGKQLKLTNLDKIMFPNNISKRDVIKYYHDIAPILLPHIQNRPLVMKRYPKGIDGESFYQKECPEHAPEWVQTYAVQHGEKTINYIICNDLPTLLWLTNLGCLEMHVWRSKIDRIEKPNILVMDLDPAPDILFKDVLKVALLVKQALKEFEVECYPKTSGSRGVHLFIPIAPAYTFAEATVAMKYIAKIIEQVYPQKCTTERVVEKRGPKIYLDYLQNTRGKTMAWHYSLRPTAEATVSTPLMWEEIETGAVEAKTLNIKSIFNRLRMFGDLYQNLLTQQQKIDKILKLV